MTTKTKTDEAPGVYACPTCGSLDVEGTAWVHLNTDEITGDEPPLDQYWCPVCEDHPPGVCLYMRADSERRCTLCAGGHTVPPPPA